jgi:ElaB/YqjD/DUF883 family membrane-anchored ribosome-binding protein
MASTTDMAPTPRKTIGSANQRGSEKSREQDLEAQVAQLQSDLKNLVEEAQDQAGEYEKQLKDTIREKPLTAVATALGIGFVLALITR